MPAPGTDEPTLLAGRYLLHEIIGRGGMGVVYRGFDTVLCRDIAVKLLARLGLDAAAELELRVRFSAEARTLAALNHPGLIMLYDAVLLVDQPYIAMELIDGQTLSQRCRDRALDVIEMASIGTELAQTLEYVHQQRVVHRDIKPSNVLLSADGRAKLADFGVARMLESSVRQTVAGQTMGTAGYMSPEQVRGEETTFASDIYSLGLVLIEALSGRPAYRGIPAAVALARLLTPPPIEATVPASLQVLLRAMTALDPAARPTAAQVSLRLQDFLVELNSADAATDNVVDAGRTGGTGRTGRTGETDRSMGGRQHRPPVLLPEMAMQLAADLPPERTRARRSSRRIAGWAGLVAAAALAPVLVFGTPLGEMALGTGSGTGNLPGARGAAPANSPQPGPTSPAMMARVIPPVSSSDAVESVRVKTETQTVTELQAATVVSDSGGKPTAAESARTVRSPHVGRSGGATRAPTVTYTSPHVATDAPTAVPVLVTAAPTTTAGAPESEAGDHGGGKSGKGGQGSGGDDYSGSADSD
jgi:hypothetical protein